MSSSGAAAGKALTQVSSSDAAAGEVPNRVSWTDVVVSGHMRWHLEALDRSGVPPATEFLRADAAPTGAEQVRGRPAGAASDSSQRPGAAESSQTSGSETARTGAASAAPAALRSLRVRCCPSTSRCRCCCCCWWWWWLLRARRRLLAPTRPAASRAEAAPLQRPEPGRRCRCRCRPAETDSRGTGHRRRPLPRGCIAPRPPPARH